MALITLIFATGAVITLVRRVVVRSLYVLLHSTGAMSVYLARKAKLTQRRLKATANARVTQKTIPSANRHRRGLSRELDDYDYNNNNNNHNYDNHDNNHNNSKH